MNCQKIRKRNRKICVGDLRDVIELQTREIEVPEFGTVDFDEEFSSVDEANPQMFALVNTVTGKNYFDGAGVDIPVTHEIYIRFQEGVTAENWIVFEGRRIDILRAEDLEERHEFLKLTCTDRGFISKEASKA